MCLMPIKTLARLLIAIGLIMMVYAMNMDVSVGSYFNLHKASQQSNTLMLGGMFFLAGIIVLVTVRPMADAVDRQEPGLSNEDIERAKAKAKQDVDSVRESLARFQHIFFARGETPKGFIIRMIGGVVAGAIAADIIHWMATMTHLVAREVLSEVTYNNSMLLIYEYSDVLETLAATLVFWYAMKGQDRPVTFRNLFGIALVFYLTLIATLYVVGSPSDEVAVRLIVSAFVCLSGLAIAMFAKGKGEAQAQRTGTRRTEPHL